MVNFYEPKADPVFLFLSPLGVRLSPSRFNPFFYVPLPSLFFFVSFFEQTTHPFSAFGHAIYCLLYLASSFPALLQRLFPP